MKERPILFSTDMVKAILDGRKTQTRRTQGLEKINQEPDRWEYMRTNNDGSFLFWVVADDPEPAMEKRTKLVKCPYGQVGDRLWVRETWAIKKCGRSVKVDKDTWPDGFPISRLQYIATDEPPYPDYWWNKRPSIFMPRWASRITLEITEVRVERVQEISLVDVLSEGIEGKMWRHISDTRMGRPSVYIFNDFRELWDSLNAKRGYGWSVNPWVFVILFKIASEG